MKKKLVIVQGAFPAISATFILSQMTGLLGLGFDVENWATKDPREQTVHQDVARYGILARTRYLFYPPKRELEAPHRWIESFCRLNGMAPEYLKGIPAIHVHYGTVYKQLEPLFNLLDCPVVVSFHGHDASRYFRLKGGDCYTDLFRRAHLITAPSRYVRNELIRHGGPPDKIVVHRYGIDLERFRNPPRTFEGPEMTLLTVARLVEKKGIEYSLRAFARVAQSHNIRYRIVGEGPLRDDLKRLTVELGVGDRVVFTGSLDADGVVREMTGADVFVLTSVTAKDGDQEGLPVSLIEAQAMGLPVISTRHAGIPELVLDGETGLLTAERDVDGAARHMEAVATDPSLRKTLSRNARKRVESEFDIRVLNQRLAGYLSRGAPQEPVVSITSPPTVQEGLITHLARKNWGHKTDLYTRVFESVTYLRPVESPAASVIIISWRFHPDAVRNLESLSRQREENFEVIFVDNGAGPGEFDVLKPHIDTYVRLNRNTGAYLARNVGSLFARAPILIFLDDDGIPASDFVCAHLDAFRNYDVIAVRGAVFPKENSAINAGVQHYYLGKKPFPRYANIEGNTSYDARIFYEVGGWDDSIVFGGGGAELAIRLFRADPDRRKQIYCPGPVIFHDYATGGGHLESKLKKQRESLKRMLKKHPDYFHHMQTWDMMEFTHKPIERKTPVRSFGSAGGAAEFVPGPRPKEKPAVSVVVPCYNLAQYLEEAVSSVLAQTYENWELLIVNDGSPDNTSEVARALIRRHPHRNIQLIEQENGGETKARNEAIRRALGRYILPLDADDRIHPRMLEKCVALLEKEPGTSIVYTDVQEFGVRSRTIPSVDFHLPTLCRFNYITCTALYRREVWERVGGYNENMKDCYEDWDFWIGAGEKGFVGRRIPEPLFYYRKREQSGYARSLEKDRFAKARIIANHPGLFSEVQRDWANRFLAGDPEAAEIPIHPTFIPTFLPGDPAGGGKIRSSRKPTKPGHRILFTMYGWNDTGGGTTFPKSVARELVQRGHRVSVFFASLKNDPAMPPYSVLKEEEDGVVLYGVYNRPALFVDPDCPEREIRDEGILERFREVLDEVQPEVVHFHNFHGLTFAMAREVRERGIPSCYTPHNYHMIDPHLYLFRSDLSLWRSTDILENSEAVQRNPGKRELYEKRAETTRKLLNEWVDLTLAVSSRQRELLVQHGARPDRVAVVHQSHASTDALWSSPELEKQRSRPLHHPLRIGFIGGVMPHKGVHVLAAAAQRFDSSRAEFHIYGFGSIEYMRFVRRLDPGERVVFHGSYTHDMLESIARELDVAVVPSLWEDCAPLVLLELMAMRLPVLGASIGGIPDFVKEGVNGFLYSHNSVESLCRCIEYCIQNRPIIRKMRSSLRRPHSFQGYVNHLETVYRDLSSRKIGDASRYDLLVRLGSVSSRPAIRWEGSQFVIHSLALVNRELCLQLMDKGCEVSILPFEPDQFGPEKDPRFARIAERVHKPLSKEPDLHVRHQWPPNFTPPPQGHWVMIQPWEYGRLPEDWIEPMSNLVDEIWVPSRHVLKTYLASGIPADRVRVIPNGVNTRLFHPQARPISLATRKKYKFLFLGGTIWRKGIDLLLQAYGAAFRREDDVVLVVKDMGQNSFYRGQGAGKLIGELQENPKFPEILYLTENLDEQEMPGLLTACDCLVHPYRGEGFGLPVLEAMACGLPVIVTAGGATDDFCTPETAYLIPSRPKGYLPNDMKLVGGALWVLEADVNALKSELRRVYEHPEEGRRMGQRALEKVRSEYTWDKVAEQVTKRAEALKNRPIRRMSPLPGPVEPCAASPAFALNTV